MNRAPAQGRVLEIALALDGEAAEAVHALFEEHGGGAVVETLHGDGDSPPLHRVVTYLAEDDVEARARIEIGLWHLGCIHPLPEAEIRRLAEANWAEAWKAHYRPLEVGRRFLITPSWIEPDPAPDRLLLRLDPGMAFGTCLHPTTQLCLRALEEHVEPGAVVLDVGTGSGILAIGASMLGAARAVGVDIDPAASRTAAANAEINGVTIETFHGSIEQAPDAAYDIVVANLLAGLVRDLAPALWARTRPGGWCLASGVLVDQAEMVAAALAGAGFEPPTVSEQGDWSLLAARRPDPHG